MLFDSTEAEDAPLVDIPCTDATWTAEANIDYINETLIHDVWSGEDDGSRISSESWTGETTFDKLLKAPPGYDVVGGRATRRIAQDMCGPNRGT